MIGLHDTKHASETTQRATREQYAADNDIVLAMRGDSRYDSWNDEMTILFPHEHQWPAMQATRESLPVL